MKIDIMPDLGLTEPGNWFHITGRGDSVSFERSALDFIGKNTDADILLNEIVIIDSELYKVMGVEQFKTGVGTVLTRGFGLLVRKINKVEAFSLAQTRPREMSARALELADEHWRDLYMGIKRVIES